MNLTKNERKIIPFIMERAKIYKNKQRGYCVRLWWKGKKLYFSKFYGYSVTRDKRNAQRLADSINESIARGAFNPKYYKRAKSYHLQEYSYS